MDDVGGEPFGNCRVWATLDAGECDVAGAAVDIWSDSVGDSADLAPGTVRIFPPLRSRAA
jgi:hypothetical protein